MWCGLISGKLLQAEGINCRRLSGVKDLQLQQLIQRHQFRPYKRISYVFYVKIARNYCRKAEGSDVICCIKKKKISVKLIFERTNKNQRYEMFPFRRWPSKPTDYLRLTLSICKIAAVLGSKFSINPKLQIFKHKIHYALHFTHFRPVVQRNTKQKISICL